MKTLIGLTMVLAAAMAATTSGHARVPPDMYCWTPDAEFPVACDDEDDEDDPGNRLSAASITLGRE